MLWFSRPCGFSSGLSEAKKDGNLLFFDNGLVVNLDNFHARVVSEFSERQGEPQSLFIFENKKFKEEVSKGQHLEMSALLFKDGESYKSLLLDRRLAQSMLVRLYFLKGAGLKYFKLWHNEVDERGNAIYVFEISWPGDEKKRKGKWNLK